MGILDGIRVLVVDDHCDSLVSLRFVLELEGATVESCDSTAAAMDAARRSTPDVLVAEFVTGDCTKLAVQIGVPSIGYTCDASALPRAVAAGFQRFILKPANPLVLIAEVRKLAARTRRTPGPPVSGR